MEDEKNADPRSRLERASSWSALGGTPSKDASTAVQERRASNAAVIASEQEAEVRKWLEAQEGDAPANVHSSEGVLRGNTGKIARFVNGEPPGSPGTVAWLRWRLGGVCEWRVPCAFFLTCLPSGVWGRGGGRSHQRMSRRHPPRP